VGRQDEDRNDINEAQTILDAEHYGLKKVKERILEYLAVQTLVPRQRGPILCLVDAGCRQDLARAIDRARDGSQVRAAVARRRAR